MDNSTNTSTKELLKYVFDIAQKDYADQASALFGSQNIEVFFKAINRDLSLYFLDIASYYKFHQSVSVQSLADSLEFYSDKKAAKKHLENSTYKHKIAHSYWHYFFATHSSSLLWKQIPDRKQKTRKNFSFIFQHGVPAITASISAMHHLDFTLPYEVLYSDDDFRNWHNFFSYIEKYISDFSNIWVPHWKARKNGCDFPLELSLYHLDLIWKYRHSNNIVQKLLEVIPDLGKHCGYPVVTATPSADSTVKHAVTEDVCLIPDFAQFNNWFFNTVSIISWLDHSPVFSRLLSVQLFLFSHILDCSLLNGNIQYYIEALCQSYISLVKYLIAKNIITYEINPIDFYKRLYDICFDSGITILKTAYPLMKNTDKKQNSYNCKKENKPQDLLNDQRYRAMYSLIGYLLYQSPGMPIKEHSFVTSFDILHCEPHLIYTPQFLTTGSEGLIEKDVDRIPTTEEIIQEYFNITKVNPSITCYGNLFTIRDTINNFFY